MILWLRGSKIFSVDSVSPWPMKNRSRMTNGPPVATKKALCTPQPLWQHASVAQWP